MRNSGRGFRGSCRRRGTSPPPAVLCAVCFVRSPFREQSVSELPVSGLCVWRWAVPGMRYCGRCTVVVLRFGMADKASGLAARFGTAELSAVRTVADVHGGIDCGACLRVGRLLPVATSGRKPVFRPVKRYRDGLRPAEASVRRIMVGTDTGAEECFLAGDGSCHEGKSSFLSSSEQPPSGGGSCSDSIQVCCNVWLRNVPLSVREERP